MATTGGGGRARGSVGDGGKGEEGTAAEAGGAKRAGRGGRRRRRRALGERSSGAQRAGHPRGSDLERGSIGLARVCVSAPLCCEGGGVYGARARGRSLEGVSVPQVLACVCLLVVERLHWQRRSGKSLVTRRRLPSLSASASLARSSPLFCSPPLPPQAPSTSPPPPQRFNQPDSLAIPGATDTSIDKTQPQARRGDATQPERTRRNPLPPAPSLALGPANARAHSLAGRIDPLVL